ncbi:MAG: RDD family protein [Candidatus Hodarchaeales archaeon]|jgi:uncharacterized RDD family membrane protein YckC
MGKKSKINQIDLYIDEVSRYLPYPKEKKQDALDELRIDVQSALNESEGKTPSSVFGSPRDVALNVSQGNNWHNERVNWLTRFFAWMIDIFALMAIILVFLSAGFLLLIITIIPFDDLMNEFSNWETGVVDLSLQGILLLTFISILTILTVIIFVGYNVVLEYRYGTTIGKKLFHLAVVDQTGIKITWKQAIIRNFSKIFVFQEFLPIDVILGMILERFDPEKTNRQRGMDILAETIVVNV